MLFSDKTADLASNETCRMESTGFPMTVHVSESFVNDMRDPSMFVPCGPRVIKGKGDMVTYLAKVKQLLIYCRSLAWNAMACKRMQHKGQSAAQGPK